MDSRLNVAMLEIDAITRRFDEVVALDGLSFSVEPGRMMGFVGPNGAGKTTTMRIILGLLSPNAGSVRWDGRGLDAAGRKRFGYMPEERGLYPKMRVRDQLEYFATLHGLSDGEARQAADAWLERLGLGEHAAKALEKLSLGNQQRVQLGAALVHDPEALVLDEPFSGLDPVGTDAMAEALLDRVANGGTVLFSSHQLDLVERLCEDVTIIKDGRLVASGSVDELRRAHGRRRVRIEVEDAPADWASRLDQGEVIERSANAVTIDLGEYGNEQVLLEEAMRAGRLRQFTPVQPSLTGLFREAMA